MDDEEVTHPEEEEVEEAPKPNGKKKDKKKALADAESLFAALEGAGDGEPDSPDKPRPSITQGQSAVVDVSCVSSGNVRVQVGVVRLL
jgi:hypothetical protein